MNDRFAPAAGFALLQLLWNADVRSAVLSALCQRRTWSQTWRARWHRQQAPQAGMA